MRISMETPKPSLAAPNVGLSYDGVVVCRGYALALIGSALRPPRIALRGLTSMAAGIASISF
jgi:hypothetical protein